MTIHDATAYVLAHGGHATSTNAGTRRIESVHIRRSDGSITNAHGLGICGLAHDMQSGRYIFQHYAEDNSRNGDIQAQAEQAIA